MSAQRVLFSDQDLTAESVLQENYSRKTPRPVETAMTHNALTALLHQLPVLSAATGIASCLALASATVARSERTIQRV